MPLRCFLLLVALLVGCRSNGRTVELEFRDAESKALLSSAPRLEYHASSGMPFKTPYSGYEHADSSASARVLLREGYTISLTVDAPGYDLQHYVFGMLPNRGRWSDWRTGEQHRTYPLAPDRRLELRWCMLTEE